MCAWCVQALANMMSLAGKGSVFCVVVSLSWYLLISCTLMTLRMECQTCQVSLRKS